MGDDEALRRLALERLGDHAPELAREALDGGRIEVDRDVLAWEGSLGTVRAHRVRLHVDGALHAKVLAMPSVVDALTAAIASAVANDSGHALAELRLEADAGPARGVRSPYRG